MKHKTTILVSLITVAFAGFAVAKAPEIESARIDSVVNQILREADNHPDKAPKPDGATIRQNVTTQLQTFEVLKNEALKVGLDKDSDVQNQMKNMQAQFYAFQYAQYLERNTVISEAQLHQLYDQQTRVIKLQQVQFQSAAEAKAAQSLLLKGLSFEELMKRYPNPEQKNNGYISPQQLPPQLGKVINQMTRGEVSHEPIQLQDKFYLFKLSEVSRNPEAQPFDLIRDKIAQQAKQQKVQEQIDKLLKENGITPPSPQ